MKIYEEPRDVSMTNSVDPLAEWRKREASMAREIAPTVKPEQRKNAHAGNVSAKGAPNGGTDMITNAPQADVPPIGQRGADKVDEDRKEGKGPELFTFEAKTKGEIDKAVKKATRGKTIVSRADQVIYRALVVIE